MRIRALLSIPVFIIGLLIVFRLSRSIVTMHGRGGRVSGLVAEIANLEKEKERLEREKAFRETEEFVEREARDKLRMTREGEHILVLPEGQNEQIPNPKSPPAMLRKAKRAGQIPNDEGEPNWKKWVDFWFGL